MNCKSLKTELFETTKGVTLSVILYYFLVTFLRDGSKEIKNTCSITWAVQQSAHIGVLQSQLLVEAEGEVGVA